MMFLFQKKTILKNNQINMLLFFFLFGSNKPNENQIYKDDIFNDKPERIKWRVKQNFDICFLMAYSRNKGTYYLQVRYF